MNSTDQMSIGIVGNEFQGLLNELKEINNDIRMAMGKTAPVYSAIQECWAGKAGNDFYKLFSDTVESSCTAMVREGEILTAKVNQIGEWFKAQDERLSEGLK